MYTRARASDCQIDDLINAMRREKKVNGELTGVNERERAILPGFHMGLAFRGFILLGRSVGKIKHSESFRTFLLSQKTAENVNIHTKRKKASPRHVHPIFLSRMEEASSLPPPSSISKRLL